MTASSQLLAVPYYEEPRALMLPQQAHPLFGVSPLKLRKRKRTDSGVSVLYIGALLTCLALGAVASRQSNFEELLSPPDICSSVPAARLLSESSDVSGDALRAVASRAYALLPLAALSLLLGAGWLCLLRHHATAVVYCTLATVPLSLLLGAGALLASTQLESTGLIATLALLALALLYSLMLCCCRRLLQLTAALIQQATLVLTDHFWGLLGAAAATLAGFGLVCAGLLAALAMLLSNGSFELADAPDRSLSPHLSPDEPQPPYECVWVLRGGWVGGGAALCALLLLWSVCLAFTTRFFSVALVTACWWFDPLRFEHSDRNHSDRADHGPTASDAAERQPSRERPGRSALRLALGPSFGTLCLAALILSACRLLNSLARMAQRQSQSLVLDLILGCVRALSRLLEFLNKFALIFHAVSAEPFCASARQMTRMLRAHGLSAYLVDRFSSLVVGAGALVGGGVAALLSAAAFDLSADAALGDEARRVAAWTFGGVGGALAFAVLFFMGDLLLNIVDSCYVCFCLDLDARRNCRPEVRCRQGL